MINYVLDKRENYGTVDILYGSRSMDDLVQLKEIQEVWMKTPGVNVYLTIDREQEGWDGHVGFVPSYLKELEFATDKTVLVCGPPIMIKFVLAALGEMGFEKTQVYTTLELRMNAAWANAAAATSAPSTSARTAPSSAATRSTNYHQSIDSTEQRTDEKRQAGVVLARKTDCRFWMYEANASTEMKPVRAESRLALRREGALRREKAAQKESGSHH